MLRKRIDYKSSMVGSTADQDILYSCFRIRMEITNIICDIGGPLNRNTVESVLTEHSSGTFQTSLPSVSIEEAKMSEFSIELIE